MKVFLPLCIAITILLSGCAYHMQIEQGINITPEQAQQVQVGMTETQVTYLLGTPNLLDPYHPNIWYYVYSNQENRSPRAQNMIIVNFDQAGKVSSVTETSNGITAHS